MSTTAAAVKQAARRLPLVREIYWHRVEAWFQRSTHANFGVFQSFSEAREWLPRTAEFDAAELADEYVNVRSRRVFAYDYPVMVWLSTAFDEGCRRVLDVGGSVGVHFLSYQRIIRFPQGLSWRVVEVPAMVRIGREIAFQAGHENLSFTEELDLDTERPDVLLSAGAIQYIEHARPGQLLARTSHRPAYVLINKVPLYDGADFVTGQNLGRGHFAPHYVFNRKSFIDGIEQAGYQLLDEWKVLERDFYLPGHPDKCFEAYTGVCFRAV